MSTRLQSPADSGRLATAALLAVTLHAGLAGLPITWRPIPYTPAVLRMMVIPPPVASSLSPIPVAAPAPLSQPTVIAPVLPTPPTPVAKAAQPSSKPTIKPPPLKPKPIRPLVEPRPAALNKAQPAPPRPHPSAVKLVKRVERPVIVAKTIDEEPDQGIAHRPPARLAPGAAADRFGSPTSSSAEKAPGARKTADNHSGGTALANAPVQPARPAVAATGLRPLAGNPPPRYPPIARQRGIEGRVLLRLTINAAGSVEAVSIAQSSGNDVLDQEARLTVARWRFQPPQGQSQTVAQVPITFRLRN
ncbi:MAG: TonB family protein [Candidatus Contendobacter sp.]